MDKHLTENAEYDSDWVNLVTASYMDYTMPRADNFPEFQLRIYLHESYNSIPLGVKGCGEAGAIAAPPTVMNAVIRCIRWTRNYKCQLQLKKFGKLANQLKNLNAKAA